MPLPTLYEMGSARGMDIKVKDYLRHYHAFLNPWKEMAVRVLEIDGVSDRMSLWRDFFPNGTVVAGNAPDEDLADPWHLVLDSRSQSDLQLAAFNELFPRVVPGGYYCIENIEASFDKANWGGKRGTFGVLNKMHKDMHGQRVTASELVYPELTPRIDFMFTVPGLVVIRRNRTE